MLSVEYSIYINSRCYQQKKLVNSDGMLLMDDIRYTYRYTHRSKTLLRSFSKAKTEEEPSAIVQRP
jgi:hypothetical protein